MRKKLSYEHIKAIHQSLQTVWRPRIKGNLGPTVGMELCKAVEACYLCPLGEFHGLNEEGTCIQEFDDWLAAVADPGGSAATATKQAILMMKAIVKILPHKERVAYRSWGKVVTR